MSSFYQKVRQSFNKNEIMLVALMGVAIGIGIFSLTNYFLVQDWKNNIEFENERGKFFASAMEAHITRTFSTIDQQTESLAQALQENKMPLSQIVVSEKANRLLVNYVYTAAYIRSFSILDESGVVLASSNKENLHLKVNFRQLGFPIDLESTLNIGNTILGRDLVDFIFLKKMLQPQRTLFLLFLLYVVSSNRQAMAIFYSHY